MRATIAIEARRDRTARHIDWDGTRRTLGRSSGCDIHIEHSIVSGHHLTFDTRADTPVVLDAGSTNGTDLNGRRLPAGDPRPIEPGDVITIGPVRIEVSWTSPAEDLDGLTGAFDRDSIEGLFAPPTSESEGLVASLEVVFGDGDRHVHALPDEIERLVIGSGEGADIALSARQPPAVAAIERTQSGFELIPVGDHGLLRDQEGRSFSEAVELADGWVGRLKDGPRLLFRDPLESQVRAFEDTPAEEPETGPTPEPSTHTPSRETDSSAPDEPPEREHPSTREILVMAALAILLAAVVCVVALFFQ